MILNEKTEHKSIMKFQKEKHLSHTQSVANSIKNIINKKEIRANLIYKKKTKEIPVLNQNGGRDFPYIANKLVTQNTFYINSSSTQYNNLNNVINEGNSRFISAGPSRIKDRKILEAHSPVKRPQTNKLVNYSKS